MGSRQLRLDAVGGTGAAPHPERRRVGRQAAHCDIVIASSSGETDSALVNDVSPYGCNLESAAEWLRTGRFVTLRTDERAIQAVVRWARDEIAGVEFLRPISDADAASLAG